MKNYLFITIIISIIFGLGSGLAGYILGRYYISYDLTGFALTREFNLMDGASNLIIRDARKVIINQDDKSAETISRVRSNLFNLIKIDKDREYLHFDDILSQAILLTNDGWLLVKIKDLKSYDIAKDLKIVDSERNIYSIDDHSLAFADFYFIKINDLKSANLFNSLKHLDLRAGQSLLAFSYNKEIVGVSLDEQSADSYIFNSDQDIRNFVLSGTIEDSFIFNINGDFLGISIDNKLYLSSLIHNKWLSLITQEEVLLPSLGLNYLDLSRTIFIEQKYPDKGALIYPILATSSPAYLAGLREGDIITRVNGQELNSNNNLSEIVLNHLAGDKLYISYLRDKDELELIVTLNSQINGN